MKLPEAIVEALGFSFFPLKLARAGASANPSFFYTYPQNSFRFQHLGETWSKKQRNLLKLDSITSVR
jgi:hypothetical protein